MNELQLRRIEIYDTTLRDGTQGEGVALSLVDKLQIAQHLDALGVDYIEGGYPLSNPKDEAFFAEARKLRLQHARLCAFGMTRRRGSPADADPGMQALAAAQAPVITIVGKTWDLHVDEVLRVSRQENLDMIRQSVAFCRQHAEDIFYDAEHFFDGYRANPDYALQTLRAAIEGGASRLILCDTNGGSLPGWVSRVVTEVGQALSDYRGGLGIHTHNDSGLAVANSLAAVEAGCIQVQGTINGIGERCGNVDLTTVVANLRLKMGYDCLRGDSLARLTETSRFVYDLANMNLVPNQPFVGAAAFAHKGGMHVHAVQRVAYSYEHVEPDRVGNTRRFLISELSGASNIAVTLGDKFRISDNKALQRQILERVQDLENQGYQFEAATASLELLVHEALGTRPRFWNLDHYRCTILKRDGCPPVTEATVKLQIGGSPVHQVAEGDGPVNALDAALRKCLAQAYPQLAQVHLRDYRVRVVNPTAESAAKVRVVAEFAARKAPDGPDASPVKYFSTLGVNENIVDASWQAITDAFDYHLVESGTPPAA
jgi:2-isopropylmalate synthase